MFKLPKLTTDIDCAAIGYPGLVVRCWLNITYDDRKEPESPKPWETMYYYGLGRILEELAVPGEFSESGQAETIPIPDAKAAYDLLNTPGFDQMIVNWAVEQFNQQRQERYRAALKN